VLAGNPYSLQVRLHAHELVLRKRARVMARIRAAVGRSVLPTPTGLYYIVELLRQPNPKGPYGPYAFGLSAHSNVLYSFGADPARSGSTERTSRAALVEARATAAFASPMLRSTRLATELPARDTGPNR